MLRVNKTAPSGAVFIHGLALLLLALITGLIYGPGLNGPFLLDDYGSLPILNDVGGVHDFRSLWRYLASDISSPLGRPIANLTFLANYHTWPTDSLPFKLTNVGLHWCVGGLLYWLAWMAAIPEARPQRAYGIAILVAAYWLLNPFNVSTTLYVVQRMTQLSALFVLAGLIAYVHGRKLQATGHVRGYVWMTCGITVFTGLAVLSKENGALLPLLAMVLEYTVLRHYLNLVAPARRWTATFLWLPSIVLLIAIFHFADHGAYAPRNFSLAERLQTECRVLFDYVWHWFNPLVSPRWVFADYYPISKGLINPWLTLPAILGILGGVVWAIWQRQRHPLASLAILFFLAGHVMESTVVPLEIYFEHRNYLPAVFLVLPLVDGLWKHSQRWHLLPVLAGLILLAMALHSYRLAMVWGDDLSLAVWSAKLNPDSSRAQDFLATTLSNKGRPDLAVVVLEKAIRHLPENSHYYLHLLVEKCRFQEVTVEEWQRLRAQFKAYPLDQKSLPLLTALVAQTPASNCRGVGVTELLQLHDELVNNTITRKKPETLRQFLHIQGVLRAKAGKPGMALQSFAQAQAIQPDISMGMLQVAQLGANGYYRDGLHWLDQVGKLPRPLGWRDRVRSWNYDLEIEHLREQLQKDLAEQKTIH